MKTIFLSVVLLISPAVLVASSNFTVVDCLLEQSEVRLDKTKVRHGNASSFDPKGNAKVATVRSTDVYNATPAGKIIKKEGVEKGTARYNTLIRQATKTYKSALKKVAVSSNYVLIVEQGGISGYSNVTDATSAIISAI
ncbi:MAG: hypothetical protein QGF46_07445 [Planctomycetota bacterium]|nr:hypothetical protein [Planctomycetota bacterium]